MYKANSSLSSSGRQGIQLSDKVLQLPSLGRPFELGMLYDCRSDSMIPGMTLWSKETLENSCDERPQYDTQFNITASDDFEQKHSALNVSASLKLSLFGGLVNLQGSGKYHSDTKSSKKQARVTLQYYVTTKYTSLTMYHLGQESIQYPYIFEKDIATHVVSAILYGAQAFFIFDQHVSTENEVQNAEGHMLAKIKKIPLVEIEGEAKVEFDADAEQKNEQFHCTFYGDFKLKKNPVTYEDAIHTYSVLPKMLGENDEHAVPFTIWLLPLSKINSKAASLVQEISVTLVTQTQNILEEFLSIKMHCNDALKDSIVSSFPTMQKKIQKFKAYCNEYTIIFQTALADILPSIRSSGVEEQKLANVLISKERSPFSSCLVNEWTSNMLREKNVISNYSTMLLENSCTEPEGKRSSQHNIKICSDIELDKELCDLMVEHVVCFNFTSLNEGDEYITYLATYLNMQESVQDTKQYTNKQEPWFLSEEVRKNMREAAKGFIEFAAANTMHKKTKFLITSINDKTCKGASIFLYKNGVLKSKQFHPPSKPGAPMVCEPTCNSLMLKIQPPQYGAENIKKYIVEYHTPGTTEWKSVETSNPDLSFTVSALQEGTEYEFRCKAVCDPGLSITSDISERMCTLGEDADHLTLDTDTAHKNLTVTLDCTTVIYTHKKQAVHSNHKRFEYYSTVLSCKSFCTGIHCWRMEIELEEQKNFFSHWGVGVVRESVSRKKRWHLVAKHGAWLLWGFRNGTFRTEDFLLHLPRTPHKLHLTVHLDYEGGQLSFYKTDNMQHLYTFSEKFTGNLFPFFDIRGGTIKLLNPPEFC
ncbi:verrucotoxin subunit beta-like isoform X2 [Protopterus annectens]|uniref:verrucotoxin subunit beta-like isoform X2 n=1 Tax=Protopterus annectens TaxID=7888 RepID=UPI001CFAB87B|nr:verrucotoxin subunit beta-like isoform X2 [Protopterus annectens]